MKKFLSALLSVAMISSAFVTSAFAANGNVSFSADTTEIAAGETVSITVKSAAKTITSDGFGIEFNNAEFELVDVVDAYGKSLAKGEAQRFRLQYVDEYDETQNQNFSVKPTGIDDANSKGIVSWGFANTTDVTYKAATIGVASFIAKENVKSGTFTLFEDSGSTDGYTGTVDTITVTVKASDVKVNGITATPAELKDLKVGDKGKIDVAVAPADATEKGVTFASDAEDVISVDADGNYEAKSAGTAKITITAKDGSGVTATVEVSVSAPVIPEPEKVQFVKAVKSDKAATGYWVFKVNKGITETLKVTYANADEKLELDAPAAIGGESDVTFALYLTVTGDRIGKAYTAAVAHGADSATGTAITLD